MSAKFTAAAGVLLALAGAAPAQMYFNPGGYYYPSSRSYSYPSTSRYYYPAATGYSYYPSSTGYYYPSTGTYSTYGSTYYTPGVVQAGTTYYAQPSALTDSAYLSQSWSGTTYPSYGSSTPYYGSAAQTYGYSPYSGYSTNGTGPYLNVSPFGVSYGVSPYTSQNYGFTNNRALNAAGRAWRWAR